MAEADKWRHGGEGDEEEEEEVDETVWIYVSYFNRSRG